MGNDGLRTVIVWFGSDWREDEMVDGGVRSGWWMGMELIVKLLGILIFILEFLMSDRVILGASVWGD